MKFPHWITSLLLLSLLSSTGHSQGNPFVKDSSFTDSVRQSLAAEILSADINNDGTADLFMSGYDSTRFGYFLDVYSNNNGTLETFYTQEIVTYSDTIGVNIGGISGMDLADFDRDGFIDVVIHGSNQFSLYMNNGTTLTPSSQVANEYLTYSKARWGDMNMDGAPDLFITGVDENQDVILNELRLNTNGTLETDQTVVYPNLFNGSMAWGDYDLDGDPDLVVSGQTADINSSSTRFYQNEPTGRLIEDSNQDILGLKASASRFADLDQDGDLDLIKSGWSLEHGLRTALYINEPLGTYTEIENAIPFGVAYGSIDAIDYDLDGDVDLFIGGVDSVNANATEVYSLHGNLYENTGSFNFILAQTFPGSRSVSFSDLNQDKRPDIIVSGTTKIKNGDSTFCSVYLNTLTTQNEQPVAPTSTNAFSVSNRAIFTWGAGTDDHTDAPALMYNIRIGSESNGNDLLSSSIPIHQSNNNSRLIREFINIPHGVYYWSVQTVDPSRQTSEWSAEDTLFIPRLVPSIQSLPGVYFSAAGWADYDGDNAIDLGLTGSSFTGGSITRFYQNESDLLEQDLTQDTKAVFGGHLSFADYTNDGHLDMMISGYQIISFQIFPKCYLYKWSNGTFVADQIKIYPTYDFATGSWFELESSVFPVVGGSNNHAWGDYDNDGDLDLIIGGKNYYGWRRLTLYKNENGEFFQDTNQTLTPIFPCITAWSDVNNDGYLDLIASGADSATQTLKTYVYLNDSTHTLTESLNWNIHFGVTAGAISVGDYDADGDDDFVILGKDKDEELKTRIYENNGFNGFMVAEELDGVYYGRADWGDYDNDGDLDLAVSGQSNTEGSLGLGSSPTTVVYSQSDGQFSKDITLNLDNVGVSSIQWGDYDSDGDLDLFVAGFKENQDVISLVFDNLESINNTNEVPTAPYNLSEDISSNNVTLNWSISQDLNSPENGFTPSDGLRYSLQIGTDENENAVLSAKIPHNKNLTINKSFYELKKIDEGWYDWRVSAIDNSYGQSDWSTTHTFYVDKTAPAIDTIRANYGIGGQIILIVEFDEFFEMNNSVDPTVIVFHPDSPDLTNNGILDTVYVDKQSFSAKVWTGVLTLPELFRGKAIEIHVAGAEDLRGNQMENEITYKTPSKIISAFGGTVISKDGNASLLLPQNTVQEDLSLTINKESSPATFSSLAMSSIYNITPDDLELLKPGIIRIISPNKDLNDSTSIFIGRISTNGDSLFYLGGTPSIINSQKVFTAEVDSLGRFGLFTYDTTQAIRKMDFDQLVCQPRLFSPAGKTFEFPSTNILFNLKSSNDVTARIFNIGGRLKKTIKPEFPLSIGSNVLSWDGKDENGDVVTSGLYIVTLDVNGTVLKTTVGVLNR